MEDKATVLSFSPWLRRAYGFQQEDHLLAWNLHAPTTPKTPPILTGQSIACGWEIMEEGPTRRKLGNGGGVPGPLLTRAPAKV